MFTKSQHGNSQNMLLILNLFETLNMLYYKGKIVIFKLKKTILREIPPNSLCIVTPVDDYKEILCDISYNIL